MTTRKYLHSDIVAKTKVPRFVRLAGYLMCGWSLVFALRHLTWAAEIRPDALAWFLCAGMLCVMGTLAALAVLQSRQQYFSRKLMLISSLSAGVLLVIYLIWSFVRQGADWVLAAGVLCAVGAFVALALVQSWGQQLPCWLLLLFAWPGGVILTLHALYGFVVHGLVLADVLTWTQVQQWSGGPAIPISDEAIRELIRTNMLIWNPWFLLGGILYLTVAWYASRPISKREKKA